MRRPLLQLAPTVHLRSVPAFADLTNEQLGDLAAEAQEVMVPAGSVLLRRGEPAHEMHLIVEGFVEAGPDLVLGPGGLVALLEVLAATPVPVGAVAATDVVAFRIDTDALRDACHRAFPVLRALLAHVADRALDERHPLLRSIVGRSARSTSPERVLDRVARMVAMRRAPALPSRSMDALGELAGRLEEVRLEPGEPLWRPGDPAFGFYVVCSGDVHLGGGPWREGDHLGPGSVPGLMATLSRRTYEYRAVASEPTLLLLAPSGPFFDVLQDHFEFAYEMLGTIARNLLEAGSGVADVGSSVAEDGGSGRSTW